MGHGVEARPLGSSWASRRARTWPSGAWTQNGMPSVPSWGCCQQAGGPGHTGSLIQSTLATPVQGTLGAPHPGHAGCSQTDSRLSGTRAARKLPHVPKATQLPGMATRLPADARGGGRLQPLAAGTQSSHAEADCTCVVTCRFTLQLLGLCPWPPHCGATRVVPLRSADGPHPPRPGIWHGCAHRPPRLLSALLRSRCGRPGAWRPPRPEAVPAAGPRPRSHPPGRVAIPSPRLWLRDPLL